MMSAEDQAKVKERPVTSLNFPLLEKKISSVQEAVTVSDVVSYPYELVERCSVLLWDFIEDYINGPDAFSELIYNLEMGGRTVTAKLMSIHEQLTTAEQMLSECHHYVDYFKKEDADNDKRAEA